MLNKSDVLLSLLLLTVADVTIGYKILTIILQAQMGSEWAIDLEAMRARGIIIIVLVKSN